VYKKILLKQEGSASLLVVSKTQDVSEADNLHWMELGIHHKDPMGAGGLHTKKSKTQPNGHFKRNEKFSEIDSPAT
tara:strand:+ start:118 stop:345 length:228 start_codon:yes stop_codon:yes gene_type:complete